MLKPNKLANNNFLSSLDMTNQEITHVLEVAKKFKNKELNIKFNKPRECFRLNRQNTIQLNM